MTAPIAAAPNRRGRTVPNWILNALTFYDHLGRGWYAYAPTQEDDPDAEGTVPARCYEDREDAKAFVAAAILALANRPHENAVNLRAVDPDIFDGITDRRTLGILTAADRKALGLEAVPDGSLGLHCGECLAERANIVGLRDGRCPECGADYRTEEQVRAEAATILKPTHDEAISAGVDYLNAQIQGRPEPEIHAARDRSQAAERALAQAGGLSQQAHDQIADAAHTVGSRIRERRSRDSLIRQAEADQLAKRRARQNDSPGT